MTDDGTAGPPPLPGDPSAEVLEDALGDDDAPPPMETAPLSAACPNCGAQCFYAPGTRVLRCEACGSEREIADTGETIEEHSFDEWQAKHARTLVADIGAQELHCQNCGAVSVTDKLSSACQFCGGALIAHDLPEGLVEPEGVLPFQVDRSAAREAFREWISSRWFAPNALKKVGSTEGLSGSYLPHWTFDAHTETDYQGQRGDYYYTTHTRTVSDGKGGTRTETYQQRHTRWRRASGHVRRDFDDVLVPASHALDDKKVAKMGPWQLGTAEPFRAEFLTGYSTVRYDVDPGAGSETARQEMRRVIHRDVESDIGGDEQRVSHLDVTYSQAMFKLLLMPLWIASYIYNGTSWQVMVNANTGEVVGDRPWSVLKIALAVIAALVVVGAIVAVVLLNKSG